MAHTPAALTLTLAPVTIADIDRLWDWIRTDDRARDALDFVRSSVDLHKSFEWFRIYESQGLGYARTIHANGAHAGFVGVFPILRAEKIAVAHLYLAPHARGIHADASITQLLAFANQAHPELRLVVFADNPAVVRWLKPFGFKPQYVLVQDPRFRRPPADPPTDPQGSDDTGGNDGQSRRIGGSGSGWRTHWARGTRGPDGTPKRPRDARRPVRSRRRIRAAKS